MNDHEPVTGAQGAPMTSDAPAQGGAVTGGDSGDLIDGTTASGAGVSRVQSGWHIIASDGQDLGPVTRIDDERLVIDRSGLLTPGELIIPREVIAEEDEEAMRAFLSIDSLTADQFAR